MGREKTFRFKQFEVLNDRTAMKVGTDGVLLGAWCPVDDAHHVLDVGTGCGVIALMVAQRNPQAVIKGIDIDHDAIMESVLNFNNSPWSNRLSAIETDFNSMIDHQRYDLIISNPPFFTNGVLPTGEARTTARHTSSLSYRQLIDGAISIQAATFASLPVRHLTRVIPVEGSIPKRTLWLFSRQDIPYHEDTLTITHSDGSFTDEYVALTGAFYLKM